MRRFQNVLLRFTKIIQSTLDSRVTLMRWHSVMWQLQSHLSDTKLHLFQIMTAFDFENWTQTN